MICRNVPVFIVGSLHNAINLRWGIPLQLKKQTDAMQRTLNKKYVVDLLSDGSEEICEMLDVLWKSIALLTKLPVLKQEYHFSSDSFTCEDRKSVV